MLIFRSVSTCTTCLSIRRASWWNSNTEKVWLKAHTLFQRFRHLVLNRQFTHTGTMFSRNNIAATNGQLFNCNFATKIVTSVAKFVHSKWAAKTFGSFNLSQPKCDFSCQNKLRPPIEGLSCGYCFSDHHPYWKCQRPPLAALPRTINYV